jgi:hypothetical protein
MASPGGGEGVNQALAGKRSVQAATASPLAAVQEDFSQCQGMVQVIPVAFPSPQWCHSDMAQPGRKSLRLALR